MIKRLVLVFFLLVLAIYFVMAITLFNKPKKGLCCNSVEVIITDSAQNGLVTAQEVKSLLMKAKKYPEGQKFQDIDLKKMEVLLMKSPYINTAECYKTATGKICIKLTQHIPMLYIINSNGERYYLDSKGSILPCSSFPTNLIVATGNITKKYAHQNLTRLGQYLQKDPFWSAQIQQIEVLSNGEIDIIPRVGYHTIQLGKPTQIEDKLKRMKTFYTEGLNKVGWNKYSAISLKYDNQIICTKNKE